MGGGEVDKERCKKREMEREEPMCHLDICACRFPNAPQASPKRRTEHSRIRLSDVSGGAFRSDRPAPLTASTAIRRVLSWKANSVSFWAN
ncbi:hypothetical protein E2C01_034754 [Portunus trituberculatus]|uniref:Uncharacterized protein n=1 Tax=Portunus trituberculatus TaxID=210409 RepID=A0A5B7F1E0_PORTR|nr:hypothetical protein [Portunus trituberculatus]